MINIEADLRPMMESVVANEELAKLFDSEQTEDSLSSLMAESSAFSFNQYMDAMAASAPERFGHMYEYGKIGEEAGRLWSMIIAGSKRVKILTYDFKEASEETPAGQAETGIAGDTRTGGHVFRWKAAVIENGIQVHVNPSGSNYLAIPVGEGASGRNRNKQNTMFFMTDTFSPKPSQVAKGAFTEAWVQHFAGVAQQVVNETVVDLTDNWFKTEPQKMYKTVGKPKVNPVPLVSRVKFKPRGLGKRSAARAWASYMSRVEAARQIARANRIGDNIVD